MNYIGSKRSLLEFLDTSISQSIDADCITFCDPFAGTGAVGVHFKQKGFSVIANDIQYYSFVLNRHLIGTNKALRFTKLTSTIPTLSNTPVKHRGEVVCEHLSTIPGKAGFIFNNYCLGGKHNAEYRRQYFSDENGLQCDAARTLIETWRTQNLVTDDEYFFLLASLLTSIDKLANTASVYGAYLKKLKKSAQTKLVIKSQPLVESSQPHFIYNQDINTLMSNVKSDIVYLDPPYNQRQYATNYHILETIARYDNPVIYGKTGLREYQDQKSLYCSRAHVLRTFAELIHSIDAKYIFLSYNDEGLMSPEDIKMVMSSRGSYQLFTQKYRRFKADTDAARKHKQDHTIEYLHMVKVERDGVPAASLFT